jgi:predicted metal-dependent hydrolase
METIHRLIRSRRRSLALIVERDGSLTVRAPLHLGEAEIERFVHAKSAWIIGKRAQAAREAPTAHLYQDGETFPFLGTDYPLQLLPGFKPGLAFDGVFKLDCARGAEAERLFTQWYRSQARRWIETRVTYFAGLHSFKPGKVRISSARTRWGSCSRRGTLNFTWRLVMAPPEVIDYVVVHELCHLGHLNHAKAFWSRVEKILPGYRQQRAWLRKHGARLQL